LPTYTQNRELSWLRFNERVLMEGADGSVPLYEQLKFVSIFTSNLDEFFMIRVGGLTDLTLLKKPVVDLKSNMTAAEQLDAVFDAVQPLYERRDELLEDIEHRLRGYDIRRYDWGDLSERMERRVSAYAARFLLPILSPQIVDPRHPFPHLENCQLYLVVHLEQRSDPFETLRSAAETSDSKRSSRIKLDQEVARAKNKKRRSEVAADEALVGIIPIPKEAPRVLRLSDDDLHYLLIETIIRHYAPQVFSMYDVLDSAIIRVTRNGDIDADAEFVEDIDYRRHMKRILRKRTFLAAVRLESQGPLSELFTSYFHTHLGISKKQMFSFASPIDFSYVYPLEDHLPAERKEVLLYPPFTPQYSSYISPDKSIMTQVHRKDVMLAFPYESMEPFLQLVKEASVNPHVVSIKITLYRLASTSRLAEYLIAAAENGIEVTVLLELRARFDEAANIGWAERFEESGCNVLYGFEGYKVHSKICLITETTNKGVEYFTQIGTGNYNEKTSTLYTDLSLMTTESSIGEDAARFFDNMALGNLEGSYEQLWVAPYHLKPSLMRKIDEQIARAQAGQTATLLFKMNSLTDLELIEKLSEASQAGVKIDLIVRGICCLLPGIAGATENIRIISIVGRYLEHARVYCFGEDGKDGIYLGSADLMTRNTEKRVEVTFPLFDASLKERVYQMLQTQLNDNTKARLMDATGCYQHIPSDGTLRNAQETFSEEAIERHLAVTEKTAEKTGEERSFWHLVRSLARLLSSKRQGRRVPKQLPSAEDDKGIRVSTSQRPRDQHEVVVLDELPAIGEDL
jgi:polyphosphate kinase